MNEDSKMNGPELKVFCAALEGLLAGDPDLAPAHVVEEAMNVVAEAKKQGLI